MPLHSAAEPQGVEAEGNGMIVEPRTSAGEVDSAMKERREELQNLMPVTDEERKDIERAILMQDRKEAVKRRQDMRREWQQCTNAAQERLLRDYDEQERKQAEIKNQAAERSRAVRKTRIVQDAVLLDSNDRWVQRGKAAIEARSDIPAEDAKMEEGFRKLRRQESIRRHRDEKQTWERQQLQPQEKTIDDFYGPEEQRRNEAIFRIDQYRERMRREDAKRIQDLPAAATAVRPGDAKKQARMLLQWMEAHPVLRQRVAEAAIQVGLERKREERQLSLWRRAGRWFRRQASDVIEDFAHFHEQETVRFNKPNNYGDWIAVAERIQRGRSFKSEHDVLCALDQEFQPQAEKAAA